MPLVKPDVEPEPEPRTVDDEVKEKAENFWSVLRTAVGKASNMRNLSKNRTVTKAFNAVWMGDKPKKKHR